ncbi:MAG: amidohydrolase [Peptococcaceae bacterium]|jgi:predicted TIM-barrel fold metal-dependent hydrolase|nr:amidohydrolase [Peptococcaceae bacterium]
MKIIDAHIHYRQGAEHFDRLAANAGHKNSEEHLREVFHIEGIERAIVMSNLSREAGQQDYPDFMSYCAGVDRGALQPENMEKSLALAEGHLQQINCVGLKIYAGYSRYDLTDPGYMPYYELAERFDKPVAVHTGVTANANALLKYSHPMQIDEIAVTFPKVQFVMCHFGNPWLMDAAAVLEKNDNVSADVSGLLVGKIDVDGYLQAQKGYVEQLKTWIAYTEHYEKFMYGTDWPLSGMPEYIRLFKHIIPEEYQDIFFYENARRIYKLDALLVPRNI